MPVLPFQESQGRAGAQQHFSRAGLQSEERDKLLGPDGGPEGVKFIINSFPCKDVGGTQGVIPENQGEMVFSLALFLMRISCAENPPLSRVGFPVLKMEIEEIWESKNGQPGFEPRERRRSYASVRDLFFLVCVQGFIPPLALRYEPGRRWIGRAFIINGCPKWMPDELLVEELVVEELGFLPDTLRLLEKRGHRLRRAGSLARGNAIQIEGAWLLGAPDARSEGTARRY